MQANEMTWEQFKELLLKETHTEAEWREIMRRNDLMDEIASLKKELNTYRRKEEDYYKANFNVANAEHKTALYARQLAETTQECHILREKIEKLQGKRKWWKL
jgi:C4-dicarboxylate-specific signal transduction histidine kinase